MREHKLRFTRGYPPPEVVHLRCKPHYTNLESTSPRSNYKSTFVGWALLPRLEHNFSRACSQAAAVYLPDQALPRTPGVPPHATLQFIERAEHPELDTMLRV